MKKTIFIVVSLVFMFSLFFDVNEVYARTRTQTWVNTSMTHNLEGPQGVPVVTSVNPQISRLMQEIRELREELDELRGAVESEPERDELKEEVDMLRDILNEERYSTGQKIGGLIEEIDKLRRIIESISDKFGIDPDELISQIEDGNLDIGILCAE